MRRIFLDSVDSTNAEGLRRAATLTGPLWIVARAQTAGRGRRMRPWASPPGNFHGSLVRRIDEPPERLALRSFAAALALRDALVALGVPAAALALKWPNDVLLGGAKVSGILLEAAGNVLATGIGVNLVAAPPPGAVEPGALPAQSVLGATGLELSPPGLLEALAPAMERREDSLRRDGFAPLRAAFLDHVIRLGQRIRVRASGQEREGIFETIDERGNLILRPERGGGPEAVAAADVFF